jgi:hypothetical protein
MTLSSLLILARVPFVLWFPIPYRVLFFLSIGTFVPLLCLATFFDLIKGAILHVPSLVDFVLIVIHVEGCPDTFPFVGRPTISIWLSARSPYSPADGDVHAVAVGSPLNARVAMSLLQAFGVDRTESRVVLPISHSPPSNCIVATMQ